MIFATDQKNKDRIIRVEESFEKIQENLKDGKKNQIKLNTEEFMFSAGD